jgi:ATP-dependent RNA helicase UAP56/SUB2
MQEVHAKCTSC